MNSRDTWMNKKTMTKDIDYRAKVVDFGPNVCSKGTTTVFTFTLRNVMTAVVPGTQRASTYVMFGTQRHASLTTSSQEASSRHGPRAGQSTSVAASLRDAASSVSLSAKAVPNRATSFTNSEV